MMFYDQFVLFSTLQCLLLSVYMSGSFILLPNLLGINIHMVVMGFVIVLGRYIPWPIYVLALKICVFPILLGLWFTFCLLSGFGLTSWMLQLLFHFPLTAIITWPLGFMWLQFAFNCMRFVQSVSTYCVWLFVSLLSTVCFLILLLLYIYTDHSLSLSS